MKESCDSFYSLFFILVVLLWLYHYFYLPVFLFKPLDPLDCLHDRFLLKQGSHLSLQFTGNCRLNLKVIITSNWSVIYLQLVYLQYIYSYVAEVIFISWTVSFSLRIPKYIFYCWIVSCANHSERIVVFYLPRHIKAIQIVTVSTIIQRRNLNLQKLLSSLNPWTIVLILGFSTEVTCIFEDI